MRVRNSLRRRQPQVWFGLFALAALAQFTFHSARGEPAPATGQAPEVLATFEGGRITREDYERVLAKKIPRELAYIARPGGREALLENMIRYDLLAQEAARRGYADRIQVKVAGRRRASDDFLATYMVDRAKVPNAEIEAAYVARRAEFGRPEMRRGTHIRLATEAEAKALCAELQGSEREQFARVAREKNLDPRTRNQGGELGYFGRDGNTESGKPTGVPIELVNETFALRKVGDVSRKPVAHDGGWSVLMYTGQMEAITKTRAELDPILRNDLAVKAEQQAVDAMLSDLRAKTPIEMHPELLDAIELPPPGSPDMPEGFAAAPVDPRAPAVILEPDGI